MTKLSLTESLSYLPDKSETQIRNAASLWFMANETWQRGEQVPASVFCLSTEALTDTDIEEARRLFPEEFTDQERGQ